MKRQEKMGEHKREYMLCWTAFFPSIWEYGTAPFLLFTTFFISYHTEPFWGSSAAAAMATNIYTMQGLWRGKMGEFKLVVWVLCRNR